MQALSPVLLSEYLPILMFAGVAFGLSLAMIGLAYLRAPHHPDGAKNAPYECGFDPIGDPHNRFDVRFYLVAILFIIFDVEVAFLFPWAVVFQDLGVGGFLSMMLFLSVLTVGFVYEWRKGALDWE